LERTVYLKEGFELRGDLSGSSFTVGPIKPLPIDLQVKAGDVLRLYKNNAILGHKVTADKPAGVGCTLPEALQRVQPGHRVFIDDGKIGAIVLSSSNEDYIELEITSGRWYLEDQTGERLKPSRYSFKHTFSNV